MHRGYDLSHFSCQAILSAMNLINLKPAILNPVVVGNSASVCVSTLKVIRGVKVGLLRSFSDASNSTRCQRLLLATLAFVRDDRDVYPTEMGPGRRFHQRVRLFLLRIQSSMSSISCARSSRGRPCTTGGIELSLSGTFQQGRYVCRACPSFSQPMDNISHVCGFFSLRNGTYRQHP